MKESIAVVLTGGPGGGKSTLVTELQSDAEWSGVVAAVPETVFLMRQTGISPQDRLFQRVVVHLQMALEDGLTRGLGDERRLILCHRGSLDPLAYWLDRGWSEDEFFAFTGTRRDELFARYAAVIHLVTAADGAPSHYARWPEAHRGETIEDAIRIDRLLRRAWCDHPNYHRLDNEGRTWTFKSQAAREILTELMADGNAGSGQLRGP